MDKLWKEALRHLDEGNFTALQEHLGGPEGFDRQVIDWFDSGQFKDEPAALNEVLSCAMMLGRTETAEYLVDKGVEPYAGMKTGLAGPHYAASAGRVEAVRMLIEKKIALNVKNSYGGTILGQALWSAVNEPSDGHCEIIERLVAAGAEVEPGMLEWWNDQPVRSSNTKQRVAKALSGTGRSEAF